MFCAELQVPSGNNGTMERISMTGPLLVGAVTKTQLKVSQPLQDGIMYLAQVSSVQLLTEHDRWFLFYLADNDLL